MGAPCIKDATQSRKEAARHIKDATQFRKVIPEGGPREEALASGPVACGREEPRARVRLPCYTVTDNGGLAHAG